METEENNVQNTAELNDKLAKLKKCTSFELLMLVLEIIILIIIFLSAPFSIEQYSLPSLNKLIIPYITNLNNLINAGFSFLGVFLIIFSVCLGLIASVCAFFIALKKYLSINNGIQTIKMSSMEEFSNYTNTNKIINPLIQIITQIILSIAICIFLFTTKQSLNYISITFNITLFIIASIIPTLSIIPTMLLNLKSIKKIPKNSFKRSPSNIVVCALRIVVCALWIVFSFSPIYVRNSYINSAYKKIYEDYIEQLEEYENDGFDLMTSAVFCRNKDNYNIGIPIGSPEEANKYLEFLEKSLNELIYKPNGTYHFTYTFYSSNYLVCKKILTFLEDGDIYDKLEKITYRYQVITLVGIKNDKGAELQVSYIDLKTHEPKKQFLY